MSTSGVMDSVEINVIEAIETAFRRCKKQSSMLTPEFMQVGRTLLGDRLITMSNDGVNLWAVEKVLLGLYPRQIEYDLPVGTLEIRNLMRRSMSRLTSGTFASSAGGTVANVSDADEDTACIQTAIGGNVSYDHGSAVVVEEVGILPYGNLKLNLVFETSEDGVTWTNVSTLGLKSLTDNEWLFTEILRPREAQYFRVRETGAAVMALREVYLGNTLYDIPIAPINKDDYINLPNKRSQNSGTPNVFYFDRQRDVPKLLVWDSVASTFTYHMVLYRHRQLEDVTTYTETIDVPRRWVPYIRAALAYDFSGELPDVPKDVIADLGSRFAQAEVNAKAGETDMMPTSLMPQIRGYTRA